LAILWNDRITDSFRGRKSARFEELKPEDVPLSQAAQTPPTPIWKSIGFINPGSSI